MKWFFYKIYPFPIFGLAFKSIPFQNKKRCSIEPKIFYTLQKNTISQICPLLLICNLNKAFSCVSYIPNSTPHDEIFSIARSI